MWIRKLVKHGDAIHSSIPAEALRATGWKRGDFVRVVLHDRNEVRIYKFDPATLPDRLRQFLGPEDVIT